MLSDAVQEMLIVASSARMIAKICRATLNARGFAFDEAETSAVDCAGVGVFAAATGSVCHAVESALLNASSEVGYADAAESAAGRASAARSAERSLATATSQPG
mmetsp:Transcript_64720/g.141004  ORF Transcript_64720/g.141004 Transcript_64720/m.141004 type:complete len:104 (+) Transcript_64720:365-676(+)